MFGKNKSRQRVISELRKNNDVYQITVDESLIHSGCCLVTVLNSVRFDFDDYGCLKSAKDELENREYA
mgnify:CR=1 FL=1